MQLAVDGDKVVGACHVVILDVTGALELYLHVGMHITAEFVQLANSAVTVKAGGTTSVQ